MEVEKGVIPTCRFSKFALRIAGERVIPTVILIDRHEPLPAFRWSLLSQVG